MENQVHLHKLGSDPEFLFATPVDLDYVITPANLVLGKNKEKTLSSFIGCDSRPVLAEIRPSPAHNVKRHLYDLAYAVHVTQKFLHENDKFRELHVVALPHLHGENLGGHVHASMFIEGMDYRALESGNYVVGGDGGFATANPNIPNGELSSMVQKRIATKAANGELVTGWLVVQVLNHLLGPFEKWIQPWVPRELRNTQYGGDNSPDILRFGTSHRPKTAGNLAWWANSGYLHVEYRLPSTWMIHPWLAFAYLGLVKFCMINWKLALQACKQEGNASKQLKSSVDLEMPGVPSPSENYHNFKKIRVGSNEEAGRLFRERFNRLLDSGARLSKDITRLPDVISQCVSARNKWFERPRPVDVEAWRRIL